MNSEQLRFDEIDSPVGRLRLRFDEAKLHSVTFVDSTEEPPAPDDSYARYPHREAFERYFEGDVEALKGLPIEMRGTAFQKTVWQALRDIPPGKTLSYSQLARRIGKSRAMRAVGSANGRNPLCIVVPCHRVISADGSLGGFSAGLDAKRWLLNHEGAQFKA